MEQQIEIIGYDSYLDDIDIELDKLTKLLYDTNINNKKESAYDKAR